jgi:hypothetical protein
MWKFCGHVFKTRGKSHVTWPQMALNSLSTSFYNHIYGLAFQDVKRWSNGIFHDSPLYMRFVVSYILSSSFNFEIWFNQSDLTRSNHSNCLKFRARGFAPYWPARTVSSIYISGVSTAEIDVKCPVPFDHSTPKFRVLTLI